MWAVAAAAELPEAAARGFQSVCVQISTEPEISLGANPFCALVTFCPSHPPRPDGRSGCEKVVYDVIPGPRTGHRPRCAPCGVLPRSVRQQSIVAAGRCNMGCGSSVNFHTPGVIVPTSAAIEGGARR